MSGWAIVTSGTYPADWLAIATRVKGEASWRCIRCQVPHDANPATGNTLTVHHLNGNKSDCRWHNLLALCQRCHLNIQRRVNPDRPWIMTEHSDWFKPYAAALYAAKYLNEELSRAEVESRLDELLDLERAAVLGGVA